MKRGLTAEEKMILRADNIYEDSMDFTKILMKLSEFERLKFIFLNEDQLTLFNLLDRPLLDVFEGESMSVSINRRFSKQMAANEEHNERLIFYQFFFF